jgi:hypothetical protein
MGLLPPPAPGAGARAFIGIEDAGMLVGGMRAGAGEGLASRTAVLGYQGADPAADTPGPRRQIGIIRCRRSAAAR